MMTSTLILHVLTYLAVTVFVVAVGVRAIRLFRMPIHLRWELYPVPHEGKRARYGGSYFEALDWWNRPRHFSLVGTLRFMLSEMLFLRALWEHNRKLWYRSFPFHWGVYTLAGLGFLVVVGALGEMMGIAVSADSPCAVGTVLHHLTIAVGIVSMVLGIVGGVSLLYLRLTDEELQDFTAPRDIFNLVFILVGFLSVFVAFASADRSFAIARSYVHSLLTFRVVPVNSLAVSIEMIVLSLLLAYIPLTHMSHFFTKWFTYHEVRWDDNPNMPGSKMEARVQEALKHPVGWSAPHVNADGRKTWADIAMEDVPSDEEKDKS